MMEVQIYGRNCLNKILFFIKLEHSRLTSSTTDPKLSHRESRTHPRLNSSTIKLIHDRTHPRLISLRALVLSSHIDSLLTFVFELSSGKVVYHSEEIPLLAVFAASGDEDIEVATINLLHELGVALDEKQNKPLLLLLLHHA